MLKKAHLFGLVAAVLAIAPSAAFAGEYQDSQQDIYQHGQAEGYGNTVVNTGDQSNYQRLNRERNGSFCGGGGYQAQASRQNIRQSGAAYGEHNTVVNRGRQDSLQNATDYANGYGGCH